MNAAALSQQIAGAIQHALSSKQTSPGEVVMILEMTKLDLYSNLRDQIKEQASPIIPFRGKINPNGG